MRLGAGRGRGGLIKRSHLFTFRPEDHPLYADALNTAGREAVGRGAT